MAGGALVAQGVVCLTWRAHLSGTIVVASSVLIVTGAFLLAGFLTPILSPLAALECIGIALSWMPVPAWSLFEGRAAIVEMIVMAVAVALLGPGAYSVDARLFGWREIVISPGPPNPEE